MFWQRLHSKWGRKVGVLSSMWTLWLFRVTLCTFCNEVRATYRVHISVRGAVKGKCNQELSLCVRAGET